MRIGGRVAAAPEQCVDVLRHAVAILFPCGVSVRQAILNSKARAGRTPVDTGGTGRRRSAIRADRPADGRGDAMARAAETPWHALPGGAALDALSASAAGLTSDEAARRLARHGPNSLPPPARAHPLGRFLAQFDNVLIYFLLASAALAFLLGHALDAAVILLVVVVNATVGFVQEGKAEQALSGMERLVSPRATVLRDGGRASIDVAGIVPGDIVQLEPGDRVPADLRILRARGLAIEEAVLTGEAVAAGKHETAVASDAALGDREDMAFSGTMVARGQATGLVVATGRDTQIGRIGDMLRAVPPLETPLLRQIDRFARRVTFAILGCAAALFVFAVAVRGFDWEEALISIVALAVGAVPEGLPAVITITLAIGVQRMARRRAVIRKLPGGGDARRDVGDLHRQDRHADAQRDDRRADLHAVLVARRRRPRLFAGGRVDGGRGTMPPPSRTRPASSAAACCATTRSCAPARRAGAGTSPAIRWRARSSCSA